MTGSCTALLMAVSVSLSAQVNISNDGLPPHSSAMLEIRSDGKGMLLPRLTENAIFGLPSPAAGLVVFNTTTGRLNYFNGTTWMEFCANPISPTATGHAPLRVIRSIPAATLRRPISSFRKSSAPRQTPEGRMTDMRICG